MTAETDTIAAIATGPGEAGISIVRISGPGSLRVADAVFRCGGNPPSALAGGSFTYGRVVEEKAGDPPRIIDEAILLVYRAPCSYTREDVAEIQCHGGAISAQRVLRRVLDAGARLADPGEFTKRAFLNGRMDLLQAEAVLDLIRARSDRAAAAAVCQLAGGLSKAFLAIYDRMLAVAADLEAGLDFPEDELPEGILTGSEQSLKAIRRDLGALLAGWFEGRLLREGVKAVISGKPNVGKSTLFNALLGSDRAIVAPDPGTTRDTLEETLLLDGISFLLIDTAGLRETDCRVEQEGVQRARAAIAGADIVLHVVDASQPLSGAGAEMPQGVDPGSCVVVLSKSDLGLCVSPGQVAPYWGLSANLLDRNDISKIRKKLLGAAQRGVMGCAHAVISERHRQAILCADRSIAEAIALLDRKDESWIVPTVSLLKEAVRSIGAVTGRVYQDELLGAVFSRFCIGK